MVDYYLADWNNRCGGNYEIYADAMWYDTSRCSYEIGGGIWDEASIRNRNVVPRPDRRWILFRGKVPKNEWGGIKTFTVGLKGTNIRRDYAALSSVNGNNVPGMRPADFFNRVTVSGCDTKYDFDLEGLDLSGVSRSSAGCSIWLGEYDFDSMRLQIPEAGTLVVRKERYTCELTEIGSATIGHSETSPASEYERLVKFGGSDAEMRWQVSGKTMFKPEYGGIGFTQMLFFPANAKSVAVVSLQADYDARHDVALLRGYVKGSGTFKVGETVKLTAVSGGALFKGWEVVYGELPSDVDLTKPVLTFVVPEAMCGTAAEMKQVTVRALWLDKSDDKAAVSVATADEYAPSTAIEPIAVDVSGCTSQPKVSVKGLPPGLKFTAKALDVKATKTTPAAHYEANTIYGVPTKSGVYTATVSVTTAGGNSAATNVVFTVVDRAAGESFLKVAYNAEMGKATGAGIYAAGRKVTLKATPQRGFVFAGWCDAEDNPLAGEADFRSPSFPYVATGVDTTVCALFARAEEDAAWLSLICDEVYFTSGAFDLTLNAQSLSLPKVALSGLPPGLKFDAKNFRISGTATRPGRYTVTARLTSASVKKAEVKTFAIVVDNLTGANGLLAVTDAAGDVGSLMNGRGEKYTISAGVSEHGLPVLNAQNPGDKLTLSGLPSGLKYDAKTGKIAGVATKAGMYTVRATVKSGRAISVSTFTVEVLPLPAWAVGTFAGCGDCEISGYDVVEANLHGTVTVAANGRVSGKFLFDTGDERLLTATVSAPSLTAWEYDPEGGVYAFDVVLAFKDGKKVVENRACRFFIAQNNYNGGVGGGMISPSDDDGDGITLYQNTWKVKGFEDLPVFAEKKTTVSKTVAIYGDDEVVGTSTLTLVVSPKGGVSGTFVEKGTDGGKPFLDKYAFKGDLIVTTHMATEEEEYYEAEIPIVIGKIATWRATVKMHVSPDGKIRSSDCKIADCPGLGDWK